MTLFVRPHQGYSGSIRPGGQLLHRSSTECVRGGDHDAATCIGQKLGELSDGGGLAHTIHADDHHHGGSLGEAEGWVIFRELSFE